jgi:hypothetical protein
MHFNISNRALIIQTIKMTERDSVLGGKTQGPQHHLVFLP